MLLVDWALNNISSVYAPNRTALYDVENLKGFAVN